MTTAQAKTSDYAAEVVQGLRLSLQAGESSKVRDGELLASHNQQQTPDVRHDTDQSIHHEHIAQSQDENGRHARLAHRPPCFCDLSSDLLHD